MKKIKLNSEAELVELFTEWLKKNGTNPEDIRKELNIGCNWAFVDVAFIDERRKMVCVELKLKDWKRVIAQAEKIHHLTPFVWICLPEPAREETKKTIERAASKSKIGLYWFNGNSFYRRINPLSLRAWIKEYKGGDIELAEWAMNFMNRGFYEYASVHFMAGVSECLRGRK
jgi:hypothetical protein